jgi:hypothetical protein
MYERLAAQHSSTPQERNTGAGAIDTGSPVHAVTDQP